MKSAAEGLERSLAAIPNKELSEALVSLCRAAENNAASFNRAAERWFDDSMERVSGWYKRRVQLILFGLAVIVVVVLNADTFAAGRVLWRDDAVRSAVVQQAEAAAASTTDDIDVDQAVSDLQLPLGWQLSFGDGATELPNDVVGWLAKLLGLAITVGAIMLGAPFWFDLLSKFVRVRGDRRAATRHRRGPQGARASSPAPAPAPPPSTRSRPHAGGPSALARVEPAHGLSEASGQPIATATARRREAGIVVVRAPAAATEVARWGLLELGRRSRGSGSETAMYA